MVRGLGRYTHVDQKTFQDQKTFTQEPASVAAVGDRLWPGEEKGETSYAFHSFTGGLLWNKKDWKLERRIFTERPPSNPTDPRKGMLVGLFRSTRPRDPAHKVIVVNVHMKAFVCKMSDKVREMGRVAREIKSIDHWAECAIVFMGITTPQCTRS